MVQYTVRSPYGPAVVFINEGVWSDGKNKLLCCVGTMTLARLPVNSKANLNNLMKSRKKKKSIVDWFEGNKLDCIVSPDDCSTGYITIIQ